METSHGIDKYDIAAQSSSFHKNVVEYKKLMELFRFRLAHVCSHGPGGAVAKHRDRGKLTARERIDLLVDRGTAFLELSSFAAWGQYDGAFPSAGIVTGIGIIEGHECMVVANDATVKGGTYVRETIKKHVRAQEIALRNRLPCIYLVDSGGIFLPEQANVFPDRFDFGRVFYNQARMSALGVPQVAVVMGSCTAGGAYVPAMCDETIIVRGQGTIFIGGPPLVKAATGEEVTAEELGGAAVHTAVSGVADYIADNDVHALAICRQIAASFPRQPKRYTPAADVAEPLHPAEEIYGFLPLKAKKNIAAKEIIKRLVDGSDFREFKADYGVSLVTGFAAIKGITIGIVANQSYLTAESARKGAHFIQLCNQRMTPLLFLQDITGFVVGRKYEHEGIARDGAKMINAVANSVVPKITIITGNSFGAGNYAMAGRAYDPEFLFTWPHARIGVMGGDQAAAVLRDIGAKQFEDGLARRMELESTAWYGSSRLWDDGIIDPAVTRNILGMAFSVTLNREHEKNGYGVFRM